MNSLKAASQSILQDKNIPTNSNLQTMNTKEFKTIKSLQNTNLSKEILEFLGNTNCVPNTNLINAESSNSKSSNVKFKFNEKKDKLSNLDEKSFNSGNNTINSLSTSGESNSRKIGSIKIDSQPTLKNASNIDYNSKEMLIRNIIYDYQNVGINEHTYEILRKKKTEKRANYLDSIEDYNDWKESYIKSTLSKLKNCSDSILNEINLTRNDFIFKLQLSDQIFEGLIMKDIEKLNSELEQTISKRMQHLNKAISMNNHTIDEVRWTLKHFLTNLKNNLVEIGFVLEENVLELIEKFNSNNIEQIDKIQKENDEKFFSIKELEDKVQYELRTNFKVFVKKWKNIKLNLFMKILKTKLNSKEIVDNDFLYELISNLKKDQINIYESRLKQLHLVDGLEIVELKATSIESSMKTLEDIYNLAQTTYDFHTNELVKFSDLITEKSKSLINDFYAMMKTISFTFGINNSDCILNLEEDKLDISQEIERVEKEYVLPPFDNSALFDKKKKLSKKEEQELKDREIQYNKDKFEMENKKKQIIEDLKKKADDCKIFIECRSYIKYYGYESLTSVISHEIDPILEKQKQERTDFFKLIVSYIDDYDEYTNKIVSRLMSSFYIKMAKLTDEHRKFLKSEEMNYQLDLAKAEDNDEDINFCKEEELNSIIKEMKEVVHHEEVDVEMDKALKVLDDLELAYREFFIKVEGILNSHEKRIINIFYTWEKNILSIVGLFEGNKNDEINKRRKFEAEFLLRVKSKLAEIEEEKLNLNNPNNKKKPVVNANIKDKKKNPNADFLDKREILISTSDSFLNFEYLIDSTLENIVEFYIKNTIDGREDDLFNLLAIVSPIESDEIVSKPIIEETSNKNQKNVKNVKDNKVNNVKDNKKIVVPQEEDLIPADIDILNVYNPFEKLSEKKFISPVMKNGTKALNEVNEMNKDIILSLLMHFKEKMCFEIKKDFDSLNNQAKQSDFERREEYLTDLDIRLKSINPRKGKLQVEEYDIKYDQITKHKEKYETYKKSILDRNNKDNIDNTKLINNVLNTGISNFKDVYTKIFKNMEDETTLKGLSDKLKKFKAEYYDLVNIIETTEESMDTYSRKNPNKLLSLNEGFKVGLIHFDKGGTYSAREIIYYSQLIDEISKNIIVKQRDNLIDSNAKLIKENKDLMEDYLQKIEKKFNIVNELIMARNCVGKIFGTSKRLINETMINMKMKVNQSIDGISKLIGNLKASIDNHDSKNKDYINKNIIPSFIRDNFSSVNNCIFYLGRYLEAFQLTNYQLERITLEEYNDGSELTKEEISFDNYKKDYEELQNLGFIAFNLNKPTYISPNDMKSNVKETKDVKDKGKPNAAISTPTTPVNPLFISEINTLDDKVRAECAKVYTGEFAKIIQNNEKMPEFLKNYLANSKKELIQFRLMSIRNLRTHSQNLFNISLGIGKVIFEYITFNSLNNLNTIFTQKREEFKKSLNKSDMMKKEVNSQLSSHLANPYYLEEYKILKKKEGDRSKELQNIINNTQIMLLITLETNADNYYKRLINNFECLTVLFDNLIFEEEYIDLGDGNDFKSQMDYNYLLKIKDLNKEVDLKSKRAIKKISIGLDKKNLRVNYYEKFKDLALEVTEKVEEKMQQLETTFSNNLFSKTIKSYFLKNNLNLKKYRDVMFHLYTESFDKNLNYVVDFFTLKKYNEDAYTSDWLNKMDKLYDD